MFSWRLLCTQWHCQAGTGLVKGNCKATTYDDILYNYTSALPTMWQQLGEEPHLDVKVRCPQTFDHIACVNIPSPVPQSFMAGPKKP